MSTYGDNIVRPFMLKYKGEEFAIGSLGLSNLYEADLYRFVKRWRPDGDIEGITYEYILSFKGIGEKKARAIAVALSEEGVEIPDIPDECKPTRLVAFKDLYSECTNCCSVLLSGADLDGRLFNFCPMCGNKLRWN